MVVLAGCGLLYLRLEFWLSLGGFGCSVCLLLLFVLCVLRLWFGVVGFGVVGLLPAGFGILVIVAG